MKSKRVDIFLNDVSLKTGYSKKDVKEVFLSQWEFVKDVLEDSVPSQLEFDVIRIPGLGRFLPNKRKYKYYRAIKQRKYEATLPNVYVGQGFDFFSSNNWMWMGKGFVVDAAPMYIGNSVFKEKYPKVIEMNGERKAGIWYYRIPLKKEERNGYI